MNTRTRTGTFLLILTLLMGALLFACAPTVSQPIVSATPLPSANPNPPTRTVTPHPTQTSTPTDILPLIKVLQTDFFASPTLIFDPLAVLSATPANSSISPALDETIVFDNELFFDSEIEISTKEQYILNYLNQGGSMQNVLDALDYTFENTSAYYGDLTGDGLPELVLTISRLLPGSLYIIGCIQGKYQILYFVDSGGFDILSLLMVRDFNQNGIPDLLLKASPSTGTAYYPSYQIVEWKGDYFQNLITQTEFTGLSSSVGYGWITMVGLSGDYQPNAESWQVKDLDQNGTWEFIISGGIPTDTEFRCHGPYQPVMQVFTWNGKGFVMGEMQIGPPEFRFQAVQNGDLYTLLQKYERAYDAYKQVINNKDLFWWTEESAAYFSSLCQTIYNPLPTPTMPVPDENEYPNLAAYAQYRMILLDVLQGQMPEAEAQVQTMQEQYLEGEEGYIFVQLAQAFWDEFSISQDIHSACARAVDFAGMHQDEVLKYIGGYHGHQSLDYEAADLCPFR